MVIPLCAMDCYCMAHLVRRFVYKMVRVYVANWCKLLVVSFITGHTPSAGNCWVYFQKKTGCIQLWRIRKKSKVFSFPSLPLFLRDFRPSDGRHSIQYFARKLLANKDESKSSGVHIDRKINHDDFVFNVYTYVYISLSKLWKRKW